MKEAFYNLLNKPESERKKVLWIVVAVFMIAMGFIWKGDLDMIISEANQNTEVSASVADVSSGKASGTFFDKFLEIPKSFTDRITSIMDGGVEVFSRED